MEKSKVWTELIPCDETNKIAEKYFRKKYRRRNKKSLFPPIDLTRDVSRHILVFVLKKKTDLWMGPSSTNLLSVRRFVMSILLLKRNR